MEQVRCIIGKVCCGTWKKRIQMGRARPAGWAYKVEEGCKGTVNVKTGFKRSKQPRRAR
jgi:hypothetical protein